MNVKCKRILCALAAVVMCLGCLCGCGEKTVKGEWLGCEHDATPDFTYIPYEDGTSRTALNIEKDGFAVMTYKAIDENDPNANAASYVYQYDEKSNMITPESNNVSGYFCATNGEVLLLCNEMGLSEDNTEKLTRSGEGEGIYGEWKDKNGNTAFILEEEHMLIPFASRELSTDALMVELYAMGLSENEVLVTAANPLAYQKRLDKIFNNLPAEYTRGGKFVSRYTQNEKGVKWVYYFKTEYENTDSAIVPERNYASVVWNYFEAAVFYHIEGNTMYVKNADMAFVRA